MHGNLRYRVAHADDDANLRAMLREYEMESWVVVTLEREPSYFAAEGIFGRDHTFICEDFERGRPVGMYGCSILPCHVNGVAVEAGYLRALRVQAQYRHRLRILKQGYNSIPVLLGGQSIPRPWFTSIAFENSNARRLLEKNLRGMPRYEPLGNLATCAFSVRRKRRTFLWEPACKADIPLLTSFYNSRASAFQFSPVLADAWLESLPRHGLKIEDFLILRRNGTIAACCALWDQTLCKQAVIKRYRFPVNIARPLVNACAALTSRMRLPPENSVLRNVFLAFFAVDGQFIHLTPKLLREAGEIAHAAGMDACLVGLAESHPQLSRIRDILRPQLYMTYIESVAWKGDSAYPLNRLPIQPEIAFL